MLTFCYKRIFGGNSIFPWGPFFLSEEQLETFVKKYYTGKQYKTVHYCSRIYFSHIEFEGAEQR
jgi:hypothetical protein